MYKQITLLLSFLFISISFCDTIKYKERKASDDFEIIVVTDVEFLGVSRKGLHYQKSTFFGNIQKTILCDNVVEILDSNNNNISFSCFDFNYEPEKYYDKKSVDLTEKSVDLTEVSTVDGVGSISYGFSSEKNPISFVEIAYLLNIDKNSEYYVALGTMLFASGIGLGYKYYFKNKSTRSLYINFGSHLSYLGTAQEGMTIYGLSISPGYSIIRKGKSNLKINYREKFGGELKKVEIKKSSANIGLSFMYMGDNSTGVIPFINFVRRF